jgi:hypothetical protein
MGDVMRTISPAMKKSMNFLRSELADGTPREAGELQRKARAKGIQLRNLMHSRKLLGIEVTSVWRMPPPFD